MHCWRQRHSVTASAMYAMTLVMAWMPWRRDVDLLVPAGTSTQLDWIQCGFKFSQNQKFFLSKNKFVKFMPGINPPIPHCRKPWWPVPTVSILLWHISVSQCRIHNVGAFYFLLGLSSDSAYIICHDKYYESIHEYLSFNSRFARIGWKVVYSKARDTVLGSDVDFTGWANQMDARENDLVSISV
jgi:hypothetical protein